MANGFDGGAFDQREQIREAIDIVDLVERYVPLRRQGANFVGRCPWHDDSRPSLQVSATRQTFKCWVCNIGGDVFSFIMRIENVDFKESMQILADMAGIELVKKRRPKRPALPKPTAPDPDAPALEPGENAPQAESIPAPGIAREYRPVEVEIGKPVLYRSMEWLARKYREALLALPEAEEARNYVRDRGITESAAENFLIGYAPLEFGAVLDWIGYDRNRVRILETAGVLAYREEYDDRGRPKPRPQFQQTRLLSDYERKRYYDRFRGRLIFPIRDVQDRVVAFGGRLLPNTTLKSPAKYVNSPETPIFIKSKMVYGLDRARNAIRREGSVLITEGYTDCIVTSQFGFENVVAVLGTALGAEHVRILKRFADRMILLLDGDEAGQKRTREVLRFFVEQGVDMRVLTLPDDNDPCEFLLEKGPDAFRDALENNTVDALDHAFAAATAGVDLENDVVGTSKALDSLLDVLALFPEQTRATNDPARLRMLGAIQRFATRFRVSEEEIRRLLAEKRARAGEYASRNREREERWEERREARDGAPETPRDDEETRIAEFRRRMVYPSAGAEGETDEQLRSLFPPFEATVWNSPALMPDALEREYLEIWLSTPSIYATLVARIPNEALRSPVARQLDQLARDCFELGLEPSFERIMLRYEDDRMKSYLIDLDEAAQAKKLAETLANPETRDAVLRDLFAGFDRARLMREEPKKMSLLREKEVAPEEKLRTLLELQRLQQLREQARTNGDGYDGGTG